MSEHMQPVIVGTGPAGIRAAQCLVKAGLRPLVLDEAVRSGGQIYRRPLVDDGRSYKSRYGSEAAKAKALHDTFEALLPQIDYRPDTLVWNMSGNGQPCQLDILSTRQKLHRQVPFDQIILCTGATDRVLPFPGWTKPGVYTLGASQTALKAQGVTIGNRLVFMGSGPLLYLVAWQYMKAGAKVAAVLDTAPLSAKFNLAKLLPLAPRIAALGVKYAIQLRLGGVKVHYNVRPVAVQGDEHIEAVRFRSQNSDKVQTIDCDALAYGFALRPETQLADLAGCAFNFNERDRAWLPERDLNGRSSRRNIYLAGDGSGIAGADAAEIAGELAAMALLEDRDENFDSGRREALIRGYQAIIRQRDVLEKMFPFPADWFETVSDETVLCRCEEIKLSEARAAMNSGQVREINRLKALSRVGMGRCQGRMCAAAATELLSSALDVEAGKVGRLRAQAPVKPIPLGFAAPYQQEID
ncbi:FAD-dependent oxidoreductase [Pseudochrobactrum sp. MP213Fo]|uniref:FAD/NAD(P)-dependent oxidoreductase n=1 Tax=Pseudochrobactrum sp. MP213Fo TaxID=3022250 RepID=UPI003BA33A76